MKKKNIIKSKKYTLIEIIDYEPHAVVSQTIVKKITGNISIVAIDAGEELVEKTSPFDTFIQVLEGEAEVVIDENSTILELGQSIIIPAHTAKFIKANKQFKMIKTVIKSGYEENLI